MTDNRTPALFFDEQMAPTKAPDLTPTDTTTLRVVHWDLENERPCLVRCEHGERNKLRIKKLVTLCGTSCEEIASTSAIPPAKIPYCQTCLALAGNGVLR